MFFPHTAMAQIEKVLKDCPDKPRLPAKAKNQRKLKILWRFPKVFFL